MLSFNWHSTWLTYLQSVPQPIMAEYYAQRASAGGLLITEATGISESGLGLPSAPGIWSVEQREAWRLVVQKVKAKHPDAVLIMQLW
jgi:2,4-dienoyl-CoA reductase-like NADH-dependent reductase (Old Yellow Enzyme family)